VPGENGMQTYWKNGYREINALKNAAGDTLNRYTYDTWDNPRVMEEETPNVLRYAVNTGMRKQDSDIYVGMI